MALLSLVLSLEGSAAAVQAAPADGPGLPTPFLTADDAVATPGGQDSPSTVPSGQATGQASSQTAGRTGGPAPSTTTPHPDVTPPEPPLERRFIVNLLHDQKAIWTSPSKLRWHDLNWLVPLGTATGISLNNDPGIQRQFVGKGEHIQLSQNISDAGLITFAGLGGVSYLAGVATHNRHARETGVLTAEAMTNTLIVTDVLNFATGRDRPGEGTGVGGFFDSGTSFPSGHASMSWAAASVIAHEYPGIYTKLFVYGLATAVSAARVSGDKHWLSDVLVGSAEGWLIGRQVYRAHHDRELGGEDWGTFSKAKTDPSEDGLLPHDFGSTYVPLDSWVYPALKRLAALGYIGSQLTGLQPWTRAECYRQALEAERNLDQAADVDEDNAEARRLLKQVKAEFAPEAESEFRTQFREFRVESLYFRYAGIGGTPLRNSFDFGQTVVNDFGRPLAEGSNLVSGFSVRGVDGHFAVYFRGEYQHAPSAPALPLSARQFIHTMDLVPTPSAAPGPSIDRFRVIEAYVQANLANLDLSVGKQSLWWGPTDMGPWMYSDNSEPIYMLRINNRRPYRLPGIFKHLGEIRNEMFLGKLSGHRSPARPMIHGEKLTIKVTPNLEVGFSRTVEFAGAGQAPLTVGTFRRSFFSFGDNPLTTKDPGDRRGGFDFSYRVPGVRDYVTVYSDSMVDDDPSPLAAPRRAAINPGIYIAQLPKLRKFDLRMESAYSDVPAGHFPGRFIYFNSIYRDGYVNNTNLLGNWVGREAKGYQVWGTYWHSAQSSVQIGYRKTKASKDFLPGGSTQDDIAGRFNLRIRPQVELTGTVQYERYLVPIIDPNRQQDVTAMFGVTFFPQHLSLRQKQQPAKP